MSNVFNNGNTGFKTGKYPLFLGENLGVYDNIHVNFPRIFKLYENLKSIDWSHNELPLDQTKMDLTTVDASTRDVMLINIAYQWKADSAIGNSLATLLLPFISNSEYAHSVNKMSENENLHALTYSNITRQCLEDPEEVFRRVYETTAVLNRLSTAFDALEELSVAGAKYKLGMITKEEARRPLIMGVAAIFILERLSFMNSFAATFALGSQNLFVGAAKYVQKICQDETIHFEIGRIAITDIINNPDFREAYLDCKEDVRKMIDTCVVQEKDFNEYLFSEGRYIVGLNLHKLNQWTDYNAQDVYDTFGFELPTERLEDPLPWIATDWVDINSHQNANMEAPNSNYSLNNVERDEGDNGALDELAEFDL